MDISFMLAAIFLEKCSSKRCDTIDDNSLKCNTTLLPPNATCSKHWTATAICNGKETFFTCTKYDNKTSIWIPSSVDCSNITTTSTTNNTNTTTNNNNNNSTNTTKTTKPSSTTTTYGLTTSDGNYTDPVVHQKQSDGNVALYVTVPIVIVVLVAVLILFIIWRRKHRNTNTKQNGFAFHNESYNRHDGTNSNDAPIPLSDRSSTAEDNQYSVIPADTVNPVSENDESTYNTIELPEGVRDNYCHVTTKTTVPNDNTYSHMTDSSAITVTDNTYSHIGNGATGSTMFQKKHTDGSADTYNTLQTLPNNRVGLTTKPRKTDIENGDIDAEYNHLANTLKPPAEAEEEENADTYSHICQSAKPDREYTEQEKKTHVLNQQSKADLKNNEHESALGVCPPYLEFKVEDQTDGDASTKQFNILENPTNETNNYEVAHTHQYFVLEKEDRMAV